MHASCRSGCNADLGTVNPKVGACRHSQASDRAAQHWQALVPAPSIAFVNSLLLCLASLRTPSWKTRSGAQLENLLGAPATHLQASSSLPHPPMPHHLVPADRKLVRKAGVQRLQGPLGRTCCPLSSLTHLHALPPHPHRPRACARGRGAPSRPSMTAPWARCLWPPPADRDFREGGILTAK